MDGAQRQGTQVIHRVSQILRMVALGNGAGVRLADLAEALGLERPTAHRLLRGLVAEQFIAFDDATKRYRLGPQLYELGLTAAARFDLLHLMTPEANRLLDATGDSVVITI